MPRSAAEISNWRTATRSGGSGIGQRLSKRTVRLCAHSTRNAAASASSSKASICNTHAGIGTSAETRDAPHNMPSEPNTVMPRPNAPALNATACATFDASTPAAAYIRIRTVPPVSTPRPTEFPSA